MCSSSAVGSTNGEEMGNSKRSAGFPEEVLSKGMNHIKIRRTAIPGGQKCKPRKSHGRTELVMEGESRDKQVAAVLSLSVSADGFEGGAIRMYE